MTKVRRNALLLMMLCSALSALWAGSMEHSVPAWMVDFKGVYYATRCLLQHHDPYSPKDLLSIYRAEGGDRPTDPAAVRRVVTMFLYFPTSISVVAPIAMISWEPAHILWSILTTGGLLLAAFLIWTLTEEYSPTVSLVLVCILLANTEVLMSVGNSAGIAVSLCVIATWCFFKGRFVSIGVLCFALSLALKPQDAGPVWLFFLLAGGVYRKRAFQTLIMTVILCLPAILWVTHVAPHWLQEQHSNMLATSGRGDLNDPSVASVTGHYPGAMIDLQTVISVFRDDPDFYNPASYLMGGALLLLWAIATLKSQFSHARTWLALAAVAALSMLPVYHRQHDAKMLLLAIPACSMMWAKRNAIGRLAFLVTGAGIVLTGDIPFTLITICTKNVQVTRPDLMGKVQTIVLTRPMPLILLVVGVFYLSIYIQRSYSDKKVSTCPCAESSN